MLHILGRQKRIHQLKDKELLEYFLNKYDNAKHVRETTMDSNWNRWAQMMDDNLWLGGIDPRSGSKIAQANELKSSIFTVLPYIIMEPPVIEIRAYNIKDIRMAAIWERVATYIDKQYDLFSEFMWAVYSALLYGNGILKLSYWTDVMIERPNWGSGLSEPFGTQRAAYAIETSLKTIYPDIRATKWLQQRYLFHTDSVHIDDVLDNPAYKSSAKKKVKPTDLPNKSSVSMPHQEVEKEYVEIIEAHDFRRGEIMVMVKDVDEFLYRGPEPYGIVPFENLEFMPRPNSVHGDSISQAVEGHVKSLSENLQFMNSMVGKAGVLKVLTKLGELRESDLAKLASNKDEIIPIVSSNLTDAVSVVDYGLAQKEFGFIQASNVIQQHIRSATGITQQERGVHEAGVETALEASMLKTASDVRNLMRKRMFSRFASRCVSKLLYIISREYPAAKLAEMSGIGPEFVPEINAGMPFDSTKFQVDYGMTAANSRNERLQNIMIFKQIVGEFANPVVLAKMAAEAMNFDFTDELMVLSSIGNNQPGTGGQVANAANSRLAQGQPGQEQGIALAG